MDPKASSQLDPKLQEAYDKVMGVSLNTPAPTTPTDPAVTIPVTPAPIDPSTVVPPVMPQDQPQPINPVPAEPTPVEPIPVAPAPEPITPPTTDSSHLQFPPEQPAQETETPQPEMATVENTVSLKPHAFVAKGEGKKISPVIWIVGGIAFLLVYTVVCFKLFNVPLPFLPQ